MLGRSTDKKQKQQILGVKEIIIKNKRIITIIRLLNMSRIPRKSI